MSSGRVRNALRFGWTPLVEGVFGDLEMAALQLEAGTRERFETGDREYGLVIIHGCCRVTLATGETYDLGPRQDPFEHLPYGLLLSRQQEAIVSASEDSLIGVGTSPARVQYPNFYLTPDDVREYQRGSDNWSRSVRFVFWADNTQGNQLLMGETVVPSGNWGTIPPHRHDRYVPEVEVPYKEVYFFRFSRPGGFGLIWQFDDDDTMDQAYSLRSNDAAYLGEGYHPVVCGPGSTMYQLTMMAGEHRMSRARLHDGYRHLTEERGMVNPYENQK